MFLKKNNNNKNNNYSKKKAIANREASGNNRVKPLELC